MELEADLAVQVVHEVPEVNKVEKEHQDHQRRYSLADTENWSYLLRLFSGVTSWS